MNIFTYIIDPIESRQPPAGFQTYQRMTGEAGEAAKTLPQSYTTRH